MMSKSIIVQTRTLGWQAARRCIVQPNRHLHAWLLGSYDTSHEKIYASLPAVNRMKRCLGERSASLQGMQPSRLVHGLDRAAFARKAALPLLVWATSIRTPL
jgi:hypothetical protein